MKKLTLVMGAMAMSLGLSGCIAQTGFHWTTAQPKAGGTTKGIVDLKGTPAANGEPNKAYFYVGVAGEGEGVTPKSFKFDPADVIGAKGKMVKDDDLAQFTDNECGPPADGATYRTKGPVKASPVDKLLQATFKFKMADQGGGFGGFVASGQWFDDGDGVPEDSGASGDTYDCSGLASTYVSTKGFEGINPRIAAP
jgi:hypothetical protein